jgi:predicted metalloenzyme YecM
MYSTLIVGLGEDLEHVFGNNGNYQELDVKILLDLESINIRHINIRIQEKATGELQQPNPIKNTYK